MLFRSWLARVVEVGKKRMILGVVEATRAQEAVPDYTKSLTGNVKGLRIGVPTNYFFDGVNEQTVKASSVASIRP